MWKNYTVQELKAIAVKYNHIHKITGVAKMKREMLIDTLEKITEFKAGKLHIKAAHGGEEIKAAGKPRVVAVYSATGKEGEHKKEEKKQATIKKRTEKVMTEAEAKAELERLQKEAKAKVIKPPEMPKSKIMVELEKIKDGLMSDKADEKDTSSGNRYVLTYEYKLKEMDYGDKYKSKTPEEELMLQTLLEYIKLTQKQREANSTAQYYKQYEKENENYRSSIGMSKKERDDILKNEKKIDFKKYYKEAEDRVKSGDLLNKRALPMELNEMILKEATRNIQRSDKWGRFYAENTYYGGDRETITKLINKTLDRYFTAKYKQFKETGNLSIYLDNQKSMVIESGKLPTSIATELNEKLKDVDKHLEQTSSYSDWNNKFTSDIPVEQKNSRIRKINKEVMSTFTNLTKLKLLKEKK
jgi:hypothetical protein